MKWSIRKATNIPETVDKSIPWVEIRNRALPELYLFCTEEESHTEATISDFKPLNPISDRTETVEQPWYIIRVATNSTCIQNRLWFFSPDGMIRNAKNPKLVMTAPLEQNSDASQHFPNGDTRGIDLADEQSGTESNQGKLEIVQHSPEDAFSGNLCLQKQVAGKNYQDFQESQHKNTITPNNQSLQDHMPENVQRQLHLRQPAINGNIRRQQHWGLRSDDVAHMGDWKLCRSVNSTRSWAKDQLLWPTLSSGSWNEKLHSPLDVMLVSRVPWRVPETKSTVHKEIIGETLERRRRGGIQEGCTHVPRLRVVRNGFQMQPVDVLVPEGFKPQSSRLNNTQIDQAFPIDTLKWFEQRLGRNWRDIISSRGETQAVHETSSIQLQLFLESCTRALNMSTPARILFTELGEPILDINKLHPDQLLYVSAGEGWIPPRSLFRRLSRLEADIHVLREINDRFAAHGHFVAVLCTSTGYLTLKEEKEALRFENQTIDDDLSCDAIHSCWELTEERHFVSSLDPSLCLAAERFAYPLYH